MNLKESKSTATKLQDVIDNVHGRVGVPILMYFLGVPGIVCVFVWLFFFKGS